MAYVKQVCQGEDSVFKGQMQAVLDLVNGATSVTLPSALSVAATAMMVARYARCAEHPEHAGLRDTCVQWIGNPWVKRTAWDAAVNDEPARLMVNSWLKQRLIKDFFELLAADGAADLRRLNYWLKWEPEITDMWFVLGLDAASNSTPEFRELRKRMSGRDRRLQDSNQGNNAFVMRIGPLVVIEFGLTGNACYVFAAADFRANLDRKLLGIHDLKQRASVAARLSHSGANWEGKFDFEIRRQLQRTPESRGSLPTMADPDTGPLRSFSLLTTPWPKITQPSHTDDLPRPKPSAPESAAAPANRVWPFARGESGDDVSAGETPQVKRPPTDGDLERLQHLFDELGIDWEDNRPKGGAFWALIQDGKSHPRIARMLLQQGFRFSPGKGYWLKAL